MEKPKGYELLSIVLTKGGGLTAKFLQETEDGSVTNRDTHTIESPTDPHKDLIAEVDALKGFFADVFNLRSFRTLINNPKALGTAKQQEAAKALKMAFDKLDADVIRKVTISKIEYKGQEDSAGIVITGSLNHNDYSQNVKTPILRFTGNDWGWEEQVTNIMDRIASEVEQYLFEGKADLDGTLFAEENGKKQEEVPATNGPGNSAETEEEITEHKVAV